MFINVMEEHAASSFGAKEYAQIEVSKKETASRLLLPSLAYILDYSFTLKMEAAYSSEISIKFHLSIWHHIPEDSVVSPCYYAVMGGGGQCLL
jgi:hypothetical protein